MYLMRLCRLDIHRSMALEEDTVPSCVMPTFEADRSPGVRHVDMHFFVIPQEEREALAVCSSFPPCPVDNVSKAIYDYPSMDVIAEDFEVDENFGGHGERRLQ